MGVPAFFRWLSRKYPSIVVHAKEEKAKVVEGVKVPVDLRTPNPNNYEFDNLYLDMNGIIHPCCHPENKPAPKNEDEMMAEIFEYIDRLMSIVRPRKLLYMAIDGVAPRAKMNQQRSRRFRAAKESTDHREELFRAKESLRIRGVEVPPEKNASEHFDSNCITPGTDFMFHLADCLRYYIHQRLNTDPGWTDLIVILSDANAPGEGEHKVMDFIRRQRALPDHNPDTRHCLCGADADLIMLGLATHETNFTIIREEFKPNQERACEICGQPGHDFKECQGQMRAPEDMPIKGGSEQEFIFLRLNVLREYLYKELNMLNLPFPQDLERAIDDWVLMCFFVGNDFLPHLPSLEIREGAIDRLIGIYKKVVYKTGGYLTEDGAVKLDRVQLMLDDLGEMEDAIFKKRREDDLQFKRRNEERQRNRQSYNAPAWVPGGDFSPVALGAGSSTMATSAKGVRDFNTHSNLQAAQNLKEALKKGGVSVPEVAKKRPFEESQEPLDEVKLWEDGWKDRYYMSKFSVSSDEVDFRHTVADEYVLGLCWVFKYYYQGCASWNWYFPYHYAPFASDFKNVEQVDVTFPSDTMPFKPLEQLMAVFPAASKRFLPLSWQQLMDQPESCIIDFYPIDFKIDLNGKKYAWQGVALLPFVDEVRLLAALEAVYPDLSEQEALRNTRGSDRLFVAKKHPSFQSFVSLYSSDVTSASIDSSLTAGVTGIVSCDDKVVLPTATMTSPLPQFEDCHDNQAICVKYSDPVFEKGHVFSCRLLPNAKLPPTTLKPGDFERSNPGQHYRSQTGFSKNNNYHNFNNPVVLNRHIRGSLPSNNYNRPPNAFNQPHNTFNQPHNTFNRPLRNYHQPPSNFGNYNRPLSNYNNNSYIQRPNNYNSYNQRSNSYNTYNQPPNHYGSYQNAGNYGNYNPRNSNYGNPPRPPYNNPQSHPRTYRNY